MTSEEYNKCVDQHADSVFRFMVKSLKDAEKARDMVQDSFEKLWRNVDSVPADKAKSYLFTTAYHTMIDWLRREKKQAPFEKADIKSLSHNEQYSDLHEILNHAIEQLPEAQKTVILLRDYEGYSYQEIADITGLNESQVKVYIYRARLFLKNHIGSYETVL